MNQGNEFGECEIAFETKLWQEAGRPFQSQALSKGKKIKNSATSLWQETVRLFLSQALSKGKKIKK
jgi:hypothetical protein